MKQTTRQNLVNRIRAGNAAIHIVSHEEQRVEGEIKAVADELNYQLCAWNALHGLTIFKDGQADVQSGTEMPIDMLKTVDAMEQPTIVVLSDFHLSMLCGDPLTIYKMKESIAAGKNNSRHFISVGCITNIPPELQKLVTVVEFELPDAEQMRSILNRVLKQNGGTVDDEEKVVNSALGMTTTEAEDAFALALVEGKKKVHAEVIQREKANTVKKNGLLEILDTSFGLDDIGGLEELKPWLASRRNAYTPEARAYRLPLPKGVLLLGPAGTGKTLTCKAAGKILGVPVLKLDVGNVFAGIVGGSEQNMRAVIQTAEAVAPCILVVDEIEKGFSGSKSSGQTDGGTSARVLGTFLQWMNDKTSSVFVMATANDITALPPELLRKGRFDELWFIDLPNKAERMEIWKIQIAKNGRKPAKFDIDALANATDGWTGAEIESHFKDGLFAAFDEGKEPTTELLVKLAAYSFPLSKTMGAQIDALREWATGRARRATKVASVKQEVGARKVNV